MGFRNLFLGDASLSSVLAGVPGLGGGKRLMQAIATFAKAGAIRDTFDGVPFAYSVEDAVSLSGPKTIEINGKNFHIQALDRATQALESLVIWGTVASGNYVQVYSRVPGDHGVLLNITAAGGGSVTDNYGATPQVDWEPITGNIAGSVAALNAGSKLLYAVVVGTGGTIATLAATALSGGVGEAVNFYLGNLLVQNTATFGSADPGTANGSYITKWEAEHIEIAVDDADLAPGQAIPTGRSALVAAAGTLMARFEWTRPRFEMHVPLQVIA
ncbi:MAG: hypothetical protein KDB07_11210 [Planctomycetes bacterium]|nr:hypothetical protein [Planctomycetota bacterium]